MSDQITIKLDFDKYLTDMRDQWGYMSEKPSSMEDLVCKRLLEELECRWERELYSAIKEKAEEIISTQLESYIRGAIDKVLSLPLRTYSINGHRWDEQPLETMVTNAVQWQVNNAVDRIADRTASHIEWTIKKDKAEE